MWVWAIFNCSPTPPQSSSSCHLGISGFSLVPHHTSLSPSPGWRSQRVATGWNRLKAESGNNPGMVRSASTFSWLGHCYTEAELSREKEGSMIKATAPFPRDHGLWSDGTHLLHQPVLPVSVLVPLVIPLPMRPLLSKGKCQQQHSAILFWTRVSGYQHNGWALRCTCTCQNIMQEIVERWKIQKGAKIPSCHPHV